MGLIDVAAWLLIGLAAGLLARSWWGGSGYGGFVDVVFGVSGGLWGGLASAVSGVSGWFGTVISWISALLFALALIGLLRLVRAHTGEPPTV